MTRAWSAHWCSEEELGSISALDLVFDETALGLNEATCVINFGELKAGLKLRGTPCPTGVTMFVPLPSGTGIIVFYFGWAAIVDHHEGRFRCNKINIYLCMDVLVVGASVAVRSFCELAIIRSAIETSRFEFDGEIAAMRPSDDGERIALDVIDPASGCKKINVEI